MASVVFRPSGSCLVDNHYLQLLHMFRLMSQLRCSALCDKKHRNLFSCVGSSGSSGTSCGKFSFCCCLVRNSTLFVELERAGKAREFLHRFHPGHGQTRWREARGHSRRSSQPTTGSSKKSEIKKMKLMKDWERERFRNFVIMFDNVFTCDVSQPD